MEIFPQITWKHDQIVDLINQSLVKHEDNKPPSPLVWYNINPANKE